MDGCFGPVRLALKPFVMGRFRAACLIRASALSGPARTGRGCGSMEWILQAENQRQPGSRYRPGVIEKGVLSPPQWLRSKSRPIGPGSKPEQV
ncbi:MAG: hypothetical protein LBD67_07380 [Candidatus Accumulibacter sp.]|nr:hypothetical protein [Accumulibacter sp.]